MTRPSRLRKIDVIDRAGDAVDDVHTTAGWAGRWIAVSMIALGLVGPLAAQPAPPPVVEVSARASIETSPTLAGSSSAAIAAKVPSERRTQVNWGVERAMQSREDLQAGLSVFLIALGVVLLIGALLAMCVEGGRNALWLQGNAGGGFGGRGFGWSVSRATGLFLASVVFMAGGLFAGLVSTTEPSSNVGEGGASTGAKR